MNYLAHLYLSDRDPDALVGSLMGDFVKGRVDASLPPRVREGIVLHRQIDSFTDAHARVLHSKRRIRPRFRRYAGILVDVFYDHFLARYWANYAEMPLEDFAGEVYAVIDERLDRLPPHMQRSMAYMLSNDLLVSYRDTEGIARALQGIERRLTRPSQLGEGVEELHAGYVGLAADFTAFFPQLIAFVESRRGDATRV